MARWAAGRARDPGTVRDRERDPATGLGMATGRGPEMDLGMATVGVKGSG